MRLFGIGDRKKIRRQIESIRPDEAPKPAAGETDESYVKDLERRINELEKYAGKNIEAMNKFASSVNTALNNIAKENSELKKENNALKTRPAESRQDGISDVEEQDLPEEEILDEAVEEELADKTVKEKSVKKAKKKSDDRETSKKVETPMDVLYDLVNKKGRVRVDDVAKSLKATSKQVEEWARILEKHDLVELQYSAVGKPYIKKK